MAEGRKKEFAAFGYGEDDEIPNPEDESTFTASKLKWDEVEQGEHAEMLAWTKALIQLRRRTVALNDGDMGHIDVRGDEERMTLVMTRNEMRVVVNLGDKAQTMEVLEDECLCLASREGVKPAGGTIELPGMSLVVFQGSTDRLW